MENKNILKSTLSVEYEEHEFELQCDLSFVDSCREFACPSSLCASADRTGNDSDNISH